MSERETLGVFYITASISKNPSSYPTSVHTNVISELYAALWGQFRQYRQQYFSSRTRDRSTRNSENHNQSCHCPSKAFYPSWLFSCHSEAASQCHFQLSCNSQDPEVLYYDVLQDITIHSSYVHRTYGYWHRLITSDQLKSQQKITPCTSNSCILTEKEQRDSRPASKVQREDVFIESEYWS